MSNPLAATINGLLAERDALRASLDYLIVTILAPENRPHVSVVLIDTANEINERMPKKTEGT